jgi:hypothetical protein
MEIVTRLSYLSAFTAAAGPASSAVTTNLNSDARSLEEDRSYVNQQNQIILLSALRELVTDCAVQGWDGENAAPIAGRVVENAKWVINSLPFTVGIPDISPQSSGKIAFEWYRAPFHQLIISVGSTSAVAYSALRGNERILGWKQLTLIGDLIEKMRAEYDLIPSNRK